MDISTLATMAGWLSHVRTWVARLVSLALPAPALLRSTHLRLRIGRGWLDLELDSTARPARAHPSAVSLEAASRSIPAKP